MDQEGGFLLSDPEIYLRKREKMNRDIACHYAEQDYLNEHLAPVQA